MAVAGLYTSSGGCTEPGVGVATNQSAAELAPCQLLLCAPGKQGLA